MRKRIKDGKRAARPAPRRKKHAGLCVARDIDHHLDYCEYTIDYAL
jgi:hypothetical protein